ncbi:hypothetical protein GCM10008959_28590 [Deinococcus seoulensis]|uniref:DUF11 domain-containing protein n=1 Tax=Deinococcus seoulensis TaxID=1837379 RepID=A0ABQ2RT67_9DEIO|nr:DUF11 domain-containing protein [Deinococcus seoulensis]GGR64779.1 hypothetical protein GCM10008959_28590 [Deinococcus seoulensis]
MKNSWKFAALIAALAAGSASAAGTAAGTVIRNTAEIVFTPEGTPTGTPPTTVPSNPVTTTVLPVPSFTIVKNDGSADRTTPDYTAPGQTATARPGDTVVFPYTLTNTGNVPNESYTLTNTPDPAAAVKTPENIRFYPVSADTNNDGTLSAAEIAAATPITTITGVNQDQAVKFFQVYTIPTAATSTDKFGGDPTGDRQDNPAFNNDPAVPRDANNSNVTTVDRKDATVIGPKNDPDGNGNPLTPAYQSTDTTPVTITPSAADTQTAQATTTTTVVTFTNTVQNNGNRPDVFDITAVQSGFPANTTVELLKPDGTPLPDTDGDGVPDVGSLNPGDTADLLVRVTFPAGSAPTTPGTQPTVTVTTTSSNDPTKKDDTKDIVNLPGLSFGNPTPTPGGDPTPVGTPEAGKPGNPGTPIIPPTTCTATSPDIRSTIAMEIANLGSAPDTFDVSGVAPIKLTDGTTRNVPVQYFKDTNGNKALDTGEVALTDTNANGIADTGVLAPGAELKLIAVVDVPCAAAAQTITLNQTAKSPTTGVTVTDPNDTITVGKTPVAAPSKTVDKTEAKPGETLTYTIIGKNTSNANVTKAFIKDTLPANTTYVSFTATSTATGPILYSTNGTAWSATAIAALSDGGTVYAGVDTNGNGTIDTGDILTSGQTITGTFTVTVK